MRFLALLLVPAALWGQPVVSSITIPTKYASHSTALVQWSSDVIACHHRLRYGSTTAYEGSMYGGIQPADFNGCQISNIQAVWSGGHYSTTMHFCPQSSTDGVTWSTCVDTTYSSGALPMPHPALPVAATTFSVAMPDTTGTVPFTVSVGCANLASQWAAAETQRLTTHAALVIADPAGCGINNFYPPGAADARYFTTGNVNTITNTITYNSHGFSNGNELIFGSDERVGSTPSGIQQSYIYYACNITTNTFQACSDVGLTMIVPLVTAGATGQCVYSPSTQSNNQLFIVPEWPLGTNWRVPEGVRYENAAWAGTAHGKMYLNTLGAGQRMGLIQQCAHEWRFMNENTTGTTSEAASSTTDPTPWGGLWQVAFSTRHIFFDRAWIHGQDFPNRLLHGIYIDGRENAVINSEVDNMSYWLSAVKVGSYLTPTIAGGGSVLSISAGTYMLGWQNCVATAPITLTITGGTPSGSVIGYFGMDCVFNFIGPTGLVATPSGSSTVNGSGGSLAAVFTTSGTPSFPVNGGGNRAAGRIAQAALSAGVLTSITSDFKPYQGGTTVYSSGEGPTGILGPCAFGTGPTMIVNNKIEAAGIGMHSDDSCTGAQYLAPGSNLTVNRNHFTLRSSWNPTSVDFDNKLREVRNLGEIKQGPVDTLTGNTFDGQWASVTPQGYAFSVFPTKISSGTNGVRVTDVTISNNWADHNSAGFQIVASEPGIIGLPPSMVRLQSSNNLVRTYSSLYDPAVKDGSQIYGLLWFTWGGIEDMTLTHNTWISDGLGAFFNYQVDQQVEGMNQANGLYVVNDPIARLGYGLEIEYAGTLPTPPSTFGKPILDWVATQGASNPTYTFNPVLVPWTTANTCNWVSGWAGTSATVETGGNCMTSTGTSRVAAVGFNSFDTGNYALTAMSPYHNAASDGTDFGAIFPTLYNAIGIVGVPVVSPIGDTTATVTTVTPDAFPCPVIVSHDAWATYTQFAGVASTTQAVNLTGLLGATSYIGKVLCAVHQPDIAFTTSGAALGNQLRGNDLMRGSTIR